MILVTGGTGRLGKELEKLIPGAIFPERHILNIEQEHSVKEFFGLYGKDVECVIHCAAVTSPPVVEKTPIRAMSCNIIGTSFLVNEAIDRGIRFIYISTDYVFDGEKGLYKEGDAVNPVNRYAWSKLGGECAVRMMEKNWAIVRCSFGPSPFPYDKAFTDQFTSRERVDITARKIVKIAKSKFCGVMHIGGERKTVFEYAKGVSPEKEIGESSIKNMSVKMPWDTSFDTSLYRWEFDKSFSED